LIVRLARNQFAERPHTSLGERFPLGNSNRADFDCEFEKDFKAGFNRGRSGRQSRMNGAALELGANLLGASAEALLQDLVLARHPYQEGTHRNRESPLLTKLLTLG
jgi:hypothetical protein